MYEHNSTLCSETHPVRFARKKACGFIWQGTPTPASRKNKAAGDSPAAFIMKTEE
jgi:hypothetical protein